MSDAGVRRGLPSLFLNRLFVYPEPMTNLSALIFDVDGTLAETEEVHRVAFNEAFAAAGLPWQWDQALYGELLAVTGGKERIAHFQATHDVPEKLAPADIAALHAAKTARYTARVAQGGLALRPGIRRLLNQARDAGLKLALATTTSHPNVTALLAACAPVPEFDVIAAGDDVPAKKPAPDVYILALQRLGLPPEACLAVEDTQNGVRSALGAGLRCLVTTSVYGGGGPFPGAVAVLSDLGEPEAPCTALAGPAPHYGFADLRYLYGLPSTGP
jgi:HAD superfamily hydrolase (TIGR01509 family)